jgi:integrase
VLKANRHQPEYTRSKNLTRASRDAFGAVDLHFHDLGREAGSRWLEGGVPLHIIRDWLGHTSIAQTSTYLAGTVQGQHDAMRAFEERLQRFATGAETGGQTAAQTDTERNTKDNKNADGRHLTIM